jgi:hypothetical protein
MAESALHLGDGALAQTLLLRRLLEEILLTADQEYRDVTAEVEDLSIPLIASVSVQSQPRAQAPGSSMRSTYLLRNVVQGVGGVDGEADQDDVGIGVRQGSETVVVLLTGRIPKCQLDVPAIDLDIGNIVLEDSGDVDLQGIVSVLRWKAFLHRGRRSTAIEDRDLCGQRDSEMREITGITMHAAVTVSIELT